MKRNAMLSIIPRPPTIQGLQLVHRKRLRFVTNSSFSGNITYANLLDTILFAATTTQSYDAFFAVRIKAIECWAAPAQGTSSSVTVQFIGTTSAGSPGDYRVWNDTSMGVEPAHVRAVPAARSNACLFQTSSSDIAFAITVPTACVVDLDAEFIGSFGQAQAAANVSVAATVGATYLRGLDGSAKAGTVFVPSVPANEQT
jgi:hypothetical protein